MAIPGTVVTGGGIHTHAQPSLLPSLFTFTHTVRVKVTQPAQCPAGSKARTVAPQYMSALLRGWWPTEDKMGTLALKHRSDELVGPHRKTRTFIECFLSARLTA